MSVTSRKRLFFQTASILPHFFSYIPAHSMNIQYEGVFYLLSVECAVLVPLKSIAKLLLSFCRLRTSSIKYKFFSNYLKNTCQVQQCF